MMSELGSRGPTILAGTPGLVKKPVRAWKNIPLISTPKSEALPSKSKVNIRNDQPTYSAIILEELC